MAMSIENVSAIVTELANLMLGKEAVASSTVAPFVAIGNVTAVQGKDPLMNAVTQMITKTYFTVRAYEGNTFKGIIKNSEQFGNAVRKIAFLESNAPREDLTYSATAMADGESPDPFIVDKVKPMEFWFSGQKAFSRVMTVTADAIKVAMRSPESLANFTANQYLHMSNMINTDKEGMARNALTNFILAKCGYNSTESSPQYSTNTDHVVNLLSEYNALTGGEYTATTVFAPTVLPDFGRFCRSRIAEISDMMTNRTTHFHQNPTGMTGSPVIARHTPKDKQHIMLVSKYGFLYDNMVKEQSHNPSAMSPLTVEKIGYLQAPDNPDSVKAKYNTLKADGTEVAVTTATQVDNIIGVLFDEDAISMTLVNEESSAIYNPRARYTNQWYFYNARYENDLTMNGVVFRLA